VPTQITEAAKVASRGPGKILLKLISPGQGSSGYYSEEVLAKAAEEKAFPRGTMGMVNHDTEMERADRPEGDLRNLIWVTLEDAYVDGNGDLVAETRVLSAWRDFVEETHEFIGASISASAAVRDTKDGRIVERLIPSPFNRVDAVTVAGRGGQVSEILEAARVIESRSIIANEVTADDIEAYISHAISRAHSDPEGHGAWLWSYDETYAYYRKGGTTFRQTYTRDGVNVTLTGEPEEVLRRTEYDPVGTTGAAESIQLTAPTTTNKLPAPAGQESSPKLAEANQKISKETTMAENATEREDAREARIKMLEESHGQLQAIKARESELVAENTGLKESLAKSRAFNRAQEFAKVIVTGANSELSESVVARIVTASVRESDLPLTESLQLDTDALTETVNKAREAEETYLAQLAKENGLGQVRGVGETTTVDTAAESASALESIRNMRKKGL